MKMKTRKLTTLGTGLLGLFSMIGSFPSPAWAGKEAGNGGGAWVCRNPEGKIVWSKLADLWEAKYSLELPLEAPMGAIDDEIQRVQLKVKDHFPKTFSDSFDSEILDVRSRMKLRKSVDVGLGSISDAIYSSSPKKKLCLNGTIQAELVAKYFPEYLLADDEIYATFSPQDQAALIIHETVYSLYRKILGATDSDSARKFTALLFTNPKNVSDYVQQLKEQPIFQSLNMSGVWWGGSIDKDYNGVNETYVTIDGSRAKVTIAKHLVTCDERFRDASGYCQDGKGYQFISSTKFQTYRFDESVNAYCIQSQNWAVRYASYYDDPEKAVPYCEVALRLGGPQLSTLQLIYDPKGLYEIKYAKGFVLMSQKAPAGMPKLVLTDPADYRRWATKQGLLP